jgi:hypothetical protein
LRKLRARRWRGWPRGRRILRSFSLQRKYTPVISVPDPCL